jgi:hypothetical protein
MSSTPPIEAPMVHEFVSACHTDIDLVGNLLEKEPNLVNACWDWGGGDFETGLGGASHMGRREIAELLLASGARLDIFCAAMLGRIDVVRAAIEFDPAIVKVPGPHGIPLLAHAVAGAQDKTAELIRSAGG